MGSHLALLDGLLPKLCPAVALSHQDGHHSAVALLLKAALIQVNDYRLLGASGFHQEPLGYRFEFLEVQCFSFDAILFSKTRISPYLYI
jgi:hypothetical protein